jgi:hypothetical protein
MRCPELRQAHRLVALVVLASAILSGCVEDEAAAPSIACDTVMCHDLAQLTRPVSGADVSPREWALHAAEGLTDRPAFILLDRPIFGFTFPRRGHHVSQSLAECAACHPLSTEGIRHGIRQYPRSVRDWVFQRSTDCAGACHTWLPVQGTASGPAPATGDALRYQGSLRPSALLAQVDGAHARIYREGYVPENGATSISFAQLRPGCGGCHNAQNENHGSLSQCLDCHRFGGQSGPRHEAHVQAILDRRAQNDPGNADLSACDYCHGFAETPTPLKNAACYNCHLSGHQPLDASGKPHFWP